MALPTSLCLWKYFGSPIQASPAIVGGKAYAISAQGIIAKLDLASGYVDWSINLQGFGNESSPAVANGKVYVGLTTGLFYVLDAASGAVVKSYNAGAAIHAAPLLLPGGVYFGGIDGRFHALDVNGNLKWVYSADLAIVHAAAAYKGQIILLDGDNHVVWLTDNGTNYTETRKVLDMECNKSGTAFQSSPMVWNNKIYAGRGEVELMGKYCGLTYYDFNTGVRGDSVMGLTTPGAARGTPVWACPSADTAAGVIYSGGGYYGLWAMNDNGSAIKNAWGSGSSVTGPNWATISSWAGYKGYYGVNSSPAVAQNCIIFGSESSYVHFFAKTGPTLGGTQMWTYKPSTNQPFSSSPAVSNGKVVIGGMDGYLYGFWNGTPVTKPDTIAGSSPQIQSGKGFTAVGELSLNVYPNPAAHGFVTITLNVVNTGDVVYLYDISGALVQKWLIEKEKDREIRWNGLDLHERPVAGGTYLAVIKNKNKQQIHSFNFKWMK